MADEARYRCAKYFVAVEDPYDRCSGFRAFESEEGAIKNIEKLLEQYDDLTLDSITFFEGKVVPLEPYKAVTRIRRKE